MVSIVKVWILSFHINLLAENSLQIKCKQCVQKKNVIKYYIKEKEKNVTKNYIEVLENSFEMFIVIFYVK